MCFVSVGAIIIELHDSLLQVQGAVGADRIRISSVDRGVPTDRVAEKRLFLTRQQD